MVTFKITVSSRSLRLFSLPLTPGGLYILSPIFFLLTHVRKTNMHVCIFCSVRKKKQVPFTKLRLNTHKSKQIPHA